ncbi:DegV family protein [Peribacillus saganii]|uniref:DegV family protein n=1 Tax=Peribacillus saganii TaxID=2303992 RepID=A0A372LQ18_9BACI|nr:DegV family protein [Peribacillus saganii]RFU69695.1 DegV family protein [Peribacillus saganii]
MGERIAWVTDSSGCLDVELEQNPDVYVVPLIVMINGKEYLDGVDIHPEEMHRMMKEDKVAPKTSQPAVGTFLDLFKKLAGEYDRIIAIHLSSRLSGTYSSSLQAAQMLDFPIMVIDSLLISYPMTFLIKKMMAYINEGLSLEEARGKLERFRDSNELYVLIGSLEQLHRSGRMSATSFILGSMLNIKPIISIEKGALEIREKTRNEKRAKTKIFSLFKAAADRGTIKECYLLYGSAEEQTKGLKTQIHDLYPDMSVSAYPIGTAVGVHAGDKTLGISWFSDRSCI